MEREDYLLERRSVFVSHQIGNQCLVLPVRFRSFSV
jgi:hypothetical protein